MKKLLKIKTLAICAILIAEMVIPFTMTAQRNDGFFRGGYDNDYINRDADDGITIEGMHNENPLAPLGSGLLIMVAAGAGYAIMRRKRSRKGTPRVSNVMMVLMALVLMLGMTQCKKKVITPTESGTVFMTVSTSNRDRTVFVPNESGSYFNWNDGVEYVVVSGSSSGYLGELSATTHGGDASLDDNRTVFSGTIIAPSASDTQLHFFYLGNGSHAQSGQPASMIIDLSNQTNGTGLTVTNYLIAAETVEAGDVTFEGTTCHVKVDLKIKTAIAYFKLTGFTSPTNDDETVYLHGADVYSSVNIDFKTGAVTGDYKGPINVGTNNNDGVYVALMHATTSETKLQFDSNSKSSSIVFPNIQEKYFYSDELSPLPITAKPLPEGALPGLFSVAKGKMVRFSKGNLKCTRTSTSVPWAEGTNATWSFMENQYDVVEHTNLISKYDTWQTIPANAILYGDYYVLPDDEITVDYGNKTEVGLLSWGSTGFVDANHHDNQSYYKPNITLPPYTFSPSFAYICDKFGPTGSNSLIVGSHSDWGYCVDYDENACWRTLTRNELAWVLGIKYVPAGSSSEVNPVPGETCRSTSNSIEDNARYTKAIIGNMRGLVLFPDNYIHPDGAPELLYMNFSDQNCNNWDNGINNITEAQWSLMQEAGAVFLPATGYREYDADNEDYPVYVYRVGFIGAYWLSDVANAYNGRTFEFDGGYIHTDIESRNMGLPVRLVYDAE